MAKSKQMNINARVSHEILKGSYSNAFKVTVTDDEVLIDFAFLFDNDGEKIAEIVSRLILRPEFAKKFGTNLIDVIEQHKKNKKTDASK